MPAARKHKSQTSPKLQASKDGELTMRQTVALELSKRVKGFTVTWQFGHASFQTDDSRVYCFITREGKLALKLPVERIAPLLESGDASLLKMGSRTMKEWLVWPDPESKEAVSLLNEAKAFVESLPPGKAKSVKKKSTAKKAASSKLKA